MARTSRVWLSELTTGNAICLPLRKILDDQIYISPGKVGSASHSLYIQFLRYKIFVVRPVQEQLTQQKDIQLIRAFETFTSANMVYNVPPEESEPTVTNHINGSTEETLARLQITELCKGWPVYRDASEWQNYRSLFTKKDAYVFTSKCWNVSRPSYFANVP